MDDGVDAGMLHEKGETEVQNYLSCSQGRTLTILFFFFFMFRRAKERMEVEHKIELRGWREETHSASGPG